MSQPDAEPSAHGGRRVRRQIVTGALALTFTLSGPLLAQAPPDAFAATSTRALGLGNAFPIGSGGSDALFYGAPTDDAFSGFSAGAGRRDAATALSMSGGLDWWQGSVAAGVVALDRGAEADSVELGVVAAYVREIGEDLAVSAGARVLQRRRSSTRGISGGVDVGASYRLEDMIWLGVSARALGASDIGDEGVLDPSVALMAATEREPLGPLDILAAATVRSRFDGPTEGGAGLEVSWWPISGRTFAGRIGVRWPESADPSLTLGAGFEGDRIIIDYAWDRAGDAHRIGLGWR